MTPNKAGVYGCLCRDPDHPNPACLQHGRTAKRRSAQSVRGGSTRLKRATGLRTVGQSKELADAYLQGAKDQMIVMMLDSDEARVWCQSCLAQGPGDFELARRWLEQHHHDEKRSQGRMYQHKERNPGRDHPAGLLYVCWKCHARLEIEGRAE